MTNVIHLAQHATPPAPATGTPPATPHDAATSRQVAIENNLSMALYYIRQNESPQNIHAATVRAVRAASMLKQASFEATTTSGRA